MTIKTTDLVNAIYYLRRVVVSQQEQDLLFNTVQNLEKEVTKRQNQDKNKQVP